MKTNFAPTAKQQLPQIAPARPLPLDHFRPARKLSLSPAQVGVARPNWAARPAGGCLGAKMRKLGGCDWAGPSRLAGAACQQFISLGHHRQCKSSRSAGAIWLIARCRRAKTSGRARVRRLGGAPRAPAAPHPPATRIRRRHPGRMNGPSWRCRIRLIWFRSSARYLAGSICGLDRSMLICAHSLEFWRPPASQHSGRVVARAVLPPAQIGARQCPTWARHSGPPIG